MLKSLVAGKLSWKAAIVLNRVSLEYWEQIDAFAKQIKLATILLKTFSFYCKLNCISSDMIGQDRLEATSFHSSDRH